MKTNTLRLFYGHATRARMSERQLCPPEGKLRYSNTNKRKHNDSFMLKKYRSYKRKA